MTNINFYFNDEYIDNSYDKNIKLNDKKMSRIDFFDNFEKTYKHFPQKISSLGVDFLIFSICVYFADKTNRRDKYLDNWSRSLTIKVPVKNVINFNNERTNIKEMLEFLTGDTWNVLFYKDNLNIEYEIEQDQFYNSIDTISMLSGGLDSFIGASDFLFDNKKPLFISHHGAGATNKYQEIIFNLLKEKYGIEDKNGNRFYADVKLNESENTTRSRSIMFFGHAVAISTAFPNINKIQVPENGYISINLPINEARLGSHSTKTTHPYYFMLFNKILTNLGINVQLENPYKFFTKGQMIQRAKDFPFISQNFDKTVSCSHPEAGRWNRDTAISRGQSQCGSCVPCIIRKAAIKKAGLEDTTRYRINMTHLTPTEFQNINAYKAFIGLKQITPVRLIDLLSSGIIPDKENYDKYLKMLRDGIEELKEVIDEC